ncbi:MAG: hypothetical protein IJG19_02075 [Methanobrevibacter sp.]|nr:hypothetical protein [Methanobrevibacter sp.]
MELKCKVVGLSYHKVDNPVTSGDTVYLMAESNKYDNDAIEVFNKEDELLGYVANSDKTLSPQNRANGNKSALELQFELDFSKKYYATVDRAFSSCIYLIIDSNKYEVLNENADDSILDELKLKVEALTIENALLKARVDTLESLIGGGK